MGVCNQITFPKYFNFISRLVTFLEFIDAPTQVPNILILGVIQNSSTLAFRYFFFLLLKCASFVPYVVRFIYIALAWILYPLQLACFLLSKKNLIIFHQSTVYDVSTHTDLDCL